MGRSYYSAEKDMEDKVRRIEEEFNRVIIREDRKSMSVGFPIDIWLESGFDEGGILVINSDSNIRSRIVNSLRIRGYKVQEASGGPDVMTLLHKSSFSLMIVQWVMFEKSGDFVSMIRKALPQTRIIITSPNFAWSSENVVGASNGKNALDAGAYSYVPDQHIDRSILTCVESSMKSHERSCPVLLSGLACNLKCTL
ncbi:MAG: response regulator [Candidatus Poribacteria bacterium]